MGILMYGGFNQRFLNRVPALISEAHMRTTRFFSTTPLSEGLAHLGNHR